MALVKFVMAVALTSGGAATCAREAPVTLLPCSVVGAEKLPADAGGADLICQEIRAAAGQAGGKASVVVTVNSAYTAAAAVTLPDGSAVPELGVSSSDRPLSRSALKMFAEQIGGKIRSPH